MLESVNRLSGGLPSIAQLNSDRIKREDVDYQRTHSRPSMASPSHLFAGPLPVVHNQSSSSSTISASLAGILSPLDKPRAVGDEKDSPRPVVRQSLPSIHEALGAEPLLSYKNAVPPPPSRVPSASHHYSSQPATTAPLDHSSTHGPIKPFSHPRSPYHGSSLSQAPPPPLPQTPQHNSRLPALHPIKTTQSPPRNTAHSDVAGPAFPLQPTTHEKTIPQSARHTHTHHQISQYLAGYPLASPASAAPDPIYPPPGVPYSASPRYPPPIWRDGAETACAEEKKINRLSLAPYGESVKRHLESFDLEASLNEMADGAGHVAGFSKVYRQRAHESQRIGMTPQSMPRLVEVDDMLKQSERIQMSLQRMRDVVFRRHQASVVEPPRDPYRPSHNYDHEHAHHYPSDENKGTGGLAGTDGKARKRGRAAPPGRCHSCHRAETPEWRRGPDGARTLCNACGLHYAKLTRKMGGKQGMTSHNLRPKSLDHGSLM